MAACLITGGILEKGNYLKDHPKGLYLLFFAELWERFSYYGMRALLMLYMVKDLMFSTEKAGAIYGNYTSLVYVAPLIGGYIADRYWGIRRCILVGSILISMGHFTLAFSDLRAFYVGLLLIILGTGFHKSNISTLVGSLYEENDPRRDGAFTIFYMGINVGALISPFVCGYLGERIGWHYGFSAAGVGMLAALFIYLWGQKRYLGDKGLKPVHSINKNNNEKKSLTGIELKRIMVIFILAFFNIFFWTAFEQAGSSLTLFADRSVNRVIPVINWEFPASWFQGVNPFFIIAFAPLFSRLWLTLARKNMEPSTPMKFVWGLCLLGTGFLFMILAAKLFLSAGPVSLLWLTCSYLFFTLGELCLSPVGLSMVTKLSPAKFASTMMGAWFLAMAASNKLAGDFAGRYDNMEMTTFFSVPFATALASALILLMLVPLLKKWMHGVH